MSEQTSQGSYGTYRRPSYRKKPISSAETSEKPFPRSVSAGTSRKPVDNKASFGFTGTSKTPAGKWESQSSSGTFRKSMIDPLDMKKYESYYYKNLWRNKNNYNVKRPRLDSYLIRRGSTDDNDEIRMIRTKDYTEDLRQLKENIYKMDLAAKERINRLQRIANVNKLLYSKDGMLDHGVSLNTKKGPSIGSTKVPYSFRNINVVRNKLPSGNLLPYLTSTSLPTKWGPSVDAEPKHRTFHSLAQERESDHLRFPYKHPSEDLSDLLGTDKYKSYTRALTSRVKYSLTPSPPPVPSSTFQAGSHKRRGKGYHSKTYDSPWSTKYQQSSSKKDADKILSATAARRWSSFGGSKKDTDKILSATAARRWSSFGGSSSEEDHYTAAGLPMPKSKGKKRMFQRDSCILYDGKKIRWAKVDSSSIGSTRDDDEEVVPQHRDSAGSVPSATIGKKTVKISTTKKGKEKTQIKDEHKREEVDSSIPGASEIIKMSKVELIMLMKKLVAIPPHKVIATLNRLRTELDKLDKLDLIKYQLMELDIGGKFGKAEATLPGSSKHKPVPRKLPAGAYESSPAIATLARHVVDDFVFDKNLTTATASIPRKSKHKRVPRKMDYHVTGTSDKQKTYDTNIYSIEEGRHSLHSSISSSKPVPEYSTHQGEVNASDSSLGTMPLESDSNKDMRRPSKATCHFAKVLGEVYHMYLRADGSTYLSMLSPAERGESSYIAFIGSYKQNEDGKMTHVSSPSSLSLIREAEVVTDLTSLDSGSSLVNTSCTAEKVPGYNYYKYEKGDGTTFLTTLSPSLWGPSCPHKFIKAYREIKPGVMVPIRTSSTASLQDITKERKVDSRMKETDVTTSLTQEQESNIKSATDSDFHLDDKPNALPVLTSSSSHFELTRVKEEDESKDRDTQGVARDSDFSRETEEKYDEDHVETSDMEREYSSSSKEASVSDHKNKEWQGQTTNEEVYDTLDSVSSIMESPISKASKEDDEMVKSKSVASIDEAANTNSQSNVQDESITHHAEVVQDESITRHAEVVQDVSITHHTEDGEIVMNTMEDVDKKEKSSSSRTSTASSKSNKIEEISSSRELEDDSAHSSMAIVDELANRLGDYSYHEAVTVDTAVEKDEFESILEKTPTHVDKGAEDESNRKSVPYGAPEQEMSNLPEDRTEAVEDDIIFPGPIQKGESQNPSEGQGCEIEHKSLSETLFKSEVSNKLLEKKKDNGMPTRGKELDVSYELEVDAETSSNSENVKNIKRDSATLLMKKMETETSSQRVREINGTSPELEFDKNNGKNTVGDEWQDELLPLDDKKKDDNSWDMNSRTDDKASSCKDDQGPVDKKGRVKDDGSGDDF